MKLSILYPSVSAVLLALIAQMVFQFYVAAAPEPAFRALIVTNGVQLGAIMWLAGIVFYTNVRSKNENPPPKPPVILPDGRPFGRRKDDNMSVIDELSEVLEREAARRPPPSESPPWAIDILKRSDPDTTERTRIESE